jgi:hypothetical protein
MIYTTPKIQKRIDWDTLEIYDISLIGDRNKQLYLDLAYKAKTKKKQTEVFFIINHERDANKLLPIKGAEYMLGTLKKTIKQKINPSFIIHLTWYNGEQSLHTYPKSVLDYFEERELAQEMLIHSGQVISVRELDDQLLASHEKIGILELFMKHADNPDLLTWIEANPDIAKKLAENKYINRSLEYVVDVGHHKIEDLIETFQKVEEKLGETMLTTAQQIEKKGMQARNIEIAKSLLSKGLDIKLIQEVTNLSKKLIEELARG